MRLTLNRLSPTNIDKLKFKLLDIVADDATNLYYLTDGIFNKAWLEKGYTQMYASLC